MWKKISKNENETIYMQTYSFIVACIVIRTIKRKFFLNIIIIALFSVINLLKMCFKTPTSYYFTTHDIKALVNEYFFL